MINYNCHVFSLPGQTGGISLKSKTKKEKGKIPKIALTSIAAVLTVIMLTACGQDPELARFRKDMDSFCTKISEIDNSINSIDATADNASSELLACLDDLDLVFQAFARLDFPPDFDYLEDVADESSQFMTEAVKNFHSAYSNGSYNEYTAEYAKQYYIKAYKRVQIIITFLHGEIPTDPDLTIEYSND